MHGYPTRKEKNMEIIESFLSNQSKEMIQLKLYGREIQGLSTEYPKIIIEKGARYKDTNLFNCTIRKQ